jgi:hypothetical protein
MIREANHASGKARIMSLSACAATRLMIREAKHASGFARIMINMSLLFQWYAAKEQILSFQRHTFSLAHFNISKISPEAAAKHVLLSQ